MNITRREFIAGASAALAASSLVSRYSEAKLPELLPNLPRLDDWSTVRAQFNLSDEYIHLAPFYISSHPKPVREAIDKYRRAIDANPVLAVDPAVFGSDSVVGLAKGEMPYLTQIVREAAADYTGGNAEDIALTDSTTMGLGLVYNGLMLKPGQEMLVTEHDFYPLHESMRFAAERTGSTMRRISLFDSFDSISEDEIIARIRKDIRPNTRTLGITWVHSSSGVKLPVRTIAAALDEINRKRDEQDRILLIVDGVHGFGVEDVNVVDLGCDIFIAGTHKWVFGPRGTGIIWARKAAWARMKPTIPSFIAADLWDAWKANRLPAGLTNATWMTCGGFKPYEHQWAMADAFWFLHQIGRKRIADRTYALNDQCKEGLATMKGVKLYTPRNHQLSAGLICFDIEGMRPEEVSRRMLERKIVMTKTPYGQSYARIAPSILLSPEEIEQVLREIRSIAQA